MSSGVATPSCTIRVASSPRATPSRLVANPGESVTSTTSLRRRRARARARSRVCASVALVRTSSRSSCTGTGLKKWVPTNRCGRRRPAPRVASDSELVLVASTASSGRCASMSRSTPDLTSRISGTASMTKGALASVLRSVVRVSASRAASAVLGASGPPTAAPSFPRASAPARLRRTSASARARAAASASTRVTGMPAANAAWTMPDPIVPPPTTPIRSRPTSTLRSPRSMPSPESMRVLPSPATGSGAAVDAAIGSSFGTRGGDRRTHGRRA